MYDPAAIEFYRSAEPAFHEQDDATFAVRQFGSGPALVLIHGYPTHGYTWHRILPTLARTRTCYTVDLPGLGDSRWRADTDFSFTAQARRLSALFDRLLPEPYALMGHDTGATMARMVAAADPQRVNALVILNTEMPGHRPPWIRTHQQLSRLPGSLMSFQLAMNSALFQRSPMGMREFYSDKSLFEDPRYLAPYVDYLVADKERMFGAIAYLRGIDWAVVDDLPRYHGAITAPVLLLWGEDDHTFPVQQGEAMSGQFAGPTRFVRIPGASLLPHEEQPERVLEHLLPFLDNGAATAAPAGAPAEADA